MIGQKVPESILGALVVLALAASAGAQTIAQRGFLEARTSIYPQSAGQDTTHVVGDFLLRNEASWRVWSWLTVAGGFDARIDTHHRVAREWRLDWSDRGAARPSLAIRRLSAVVRRGGLVVEAGKQFVRWGRADVLNPTDRFAPRDFAEVVSSEFLAVTAARLTWERRADTFEAVWVPRFTPSRIPLQNDRWAVGLAGLALAGGPGPPMAASDLGARYPSRSQFGARWSHVASRLEFSLSAYDGFNHLPAFDVRVVSPSFGVPPLVGVVRAHPRLRMVGGDLAVPLRWVTLKAEAAYFASPGGRADDYGIYVVQAERQTGEWLLVAGYAGEVVHHRRGPAASDAFTQSFAIDRGLASAFLGRASCTLDANRSVAFQGAVRRNAKGAWLEAEYSQAAGQHLRATARAILVRGDDSDFLGRFRRNSRVDLVLRYSF